ncbi:SMI1/KNR4 family protein [Cytophagaceae bacterium DM2B3-1]|uniref:SMI1/KNR4 family protein n=1 Tax=Xanthocytophaga flava TaxID=3048013 RepID=A0ABT7CMV6_9BACT|nr:SMI1/KNR4 family protein [Xanthocytophaga flavus]MDJ1495010.1 SMI1/KNR4 family protein [Xanthocytophaga flavus]
MKELIELIAQKHWESGIDVNPPANLSEIEDFERLVGFLLPADFREFYLTCNGFACNEDIFNMLPLSIIRQFPKDYGVNWFYFSEYMICSDKWGLRLTSSGEYEIFNGSYPDKALTNSLSEFLKRFLKGNVFDTDGLYDWHDEIGIN